MFGPWLFLSNLIEWLPLETFCFGETSRIQLRDEQLSLEARTIAIWGAPACQSSGGSGRCVLRHRRPVASFIYTSDSAALRADTRYVLHRQRSSQRKWPGRLSEETNTLFTLPFISINSV
ncbi:hypothetical protein AMECASPLE_005466 [Ameca splendens]|uniref:Secreted protein n=1 Tax=Ameca splendens TaxID=208324 RepID=A0ABV1A5D9_9TELE